MEGYLSLCSDIYRLRIYPLTLMLSTAIGVEPWALFTERFVVAKSITPWAPALFCTAGSTVAPR